METYDDWEPMVCFPYSMWVKHVQIVEELIAFSQEGKEIWDEIRKKTTNNE
jgi:hypothetical protein